MHFSQEQRKLGSTYETPVTNYLKVNTSDRGIPWEVAMKKTGHGAKHDLVCVSRAGGDPRQDTNEIGKWSGSLAQYKILFTFLKKHVPPCVQSLS